MDGRNKKVFDPKNSISEKGMRRYQNHLIPVQMQYLVAQPEFASIFTVPIEMPKRKTPHWYVPCQKRNFSKFENLDIRWADGTDHSFKKSRI